MKVVVIHSNKRKGNTYELTRRVLQNLEGFTDLETRIFYLSTDFPYFCTGCHSCFMNGEHTCGHFEALKPLIEAIEWADGVILTSPVYVMGPSGNMKAFMDHLGYMWIVHRPKPIHFKKVGLAISTAGGAGMGPTNKLMCKFFQFMGFKRVYRLGVRGEAVTQGIADRKIARVSRKFYKTFQKREQLGQTLFQRLFGWAMKSSIRRYDEASLLKRDKAYWKEQGWLDGKAMWK
ncbi:MAG: flavodoxin family protein [Cellulosilyticaceae bacterium]